MESDNTQKLREEDEFASDPNAIARGTVPSVALGAPELYVNPAGIGPTMTSFLSTSQADSFEQTGELIHEKAHELKEKVHHAVDKVKEKIH